MTCIVGLVDKGRIYMGADGAGADSGWSLTCGADEKVFRNGPCLMGFTTSWRMGQVLRFALKVPDHDPRVGVRRYVATVFADAVRKCLKDAGFQTTKDEVDKGGNFLLGYRGRLFEIQSDYSYAHGLDGYLAVGCGGSIALGSLHSTKGRPAATRVRMALEAAEHFSAGVRRPFMVRSMKVM